MNQPDETGQEIEALRERISRLSAAILRISASLDPATVLQEVVDSARVLAAAQKRSSSPGRLLARGPPQNRTRRLPPSYVVDNIRWCMWRTCLCGEVVLTD